MAVAAVSTVVAAIVGVGLLAARSSTSSAGRPGPVPSGISAAGYARSLLQDVPLPADASRRYGSLPVGDAPDRPTRSSRTTAVADATWVTAGSVDGTAGYVTAHRPTGWTTAGETTFGAGAGRDTAVQLTMIVHGPRGLIAAVSVTVPRHLDGAALLVDVQVTRSVRTAAQVVPLVRGDTARVALSGTNNATRHTTTLHRTLRAVDTASLARRVNAALPAVPDDYAGPRGCPVQQDTWTITVRTGRWSVTATFQDCSGIRTEVSGFAIDGGQQVVGALLNDLHLPDTWWQH